MGQSLVKNYRHIVFSTKNRLNTITPEIEEQLYKYIGRIIKSLDSKLIKIGGFTDHIHILCELSKNYSLSDFMKRLKGSTSKWVNVTFTLNYHFNWQSGYGAFSIKPQDVSLVVEYISNQKEHHKRTDFKNELTKFLNQYKIPYNPKYIWD